MKSRRTARFHELQLAKAITRKRLRKSAPSTRTKVWDNDALKELMKQVVREVLQEQRITPAAPTSGNAEFDYIEEARQVRSRVPMSEDSTPLLRSIREERAGL